MRRQGWPPLTRQSPGYPIEGGARFCLRQNRPPPSGRGYPELCLAKGVSPPLSRQNKRGGWLPLLRHFFVPKLVLLQTRRQVRPRSSRDHHFNPTDVLYRSSSSMGVPEYGSAPPLGDASWAPLASAGHPWLPPGAHETTGGYASRIPPPKKQ